MPLQGCRGSEDGQDLHESPVAGQILHHHQPESAGTHRESNDTGGQLRCPSSKWILLGHRLGPASFGEPVHPGTASPLHTHGSQVTGPGNQVTPSPDTLVFPG